MTQALVSSIVAFAEAFAKQCGGEGIREMYVAPSVFDLVAAYIIRGYSLNPDCPEGTYHRRGVVDLYTANGRVRIRVAD